MFTVAWDYPTGFCCIHDRWSDILECTQVGIQMGNIRRCTMYRFVGRSGHKLLHWRGHVDRVSNGIGGSLYED